VAARIAAAADSGHHPADDADLERLLIDERQEFLAVFGNAHEFEALVLVEQTPQARANQRALVRNHHRNQGFAQRRHRDGFDHR
jgi:hypothetical protein